MRLFYSALFYALTPWVLGRLAWRGRKLPAYRERWRERFAYYEVPPPEPGSVWFHAVSVGEAEAAFPIIRAFCARHPDLSILVTCGTPTGSARIRAVLGDSVQHVYLPYDLPDSVARFLNQFRPRLGVILETEIWPNLYRVCQERAIPLTIVNGRLSEKSARGYQRLAGLTRESLAAVSRIAAQAQPDAERYIAIGAQPDTVSITGNVKFDIEYSAAMAEQADAIRAELFGSRPIWIAGSTHPGEEEQVLAALDQVRRDLPETLLILAPRHPERTDEILALCRKTGHTVRRRSEALPCAPETRVFLLDSLGELRQFYGVADAAFVGGSLVARGGHNVLEPAAAGKAVAFGPYMFNFAEIGRRLKSSGGAVEVADAGRLAGWVAEMLAHPERRAEMGGKGFEFVAANRGAVIRVVDLIDELLAPDRHG